MEITLEDGSTRTSCGHECNIIRDGEACTDCQRAAARNKIFQKPIVHIESGHAMVASEIFADGLIFDGFKYDWATVEANFAPVNGRNFRKNQINF
ncbi:hypothetical protein LAG90_15795 [Marinilongibacter aquaticus]|uniref:hypothetical protein n=1 Tax=Marinilongibacter aquaticus TaxID=2975157 RepID=UPI0021BDA28E|nr:hypothetical protein [Marinilongibacter aquaticus]UBM58267.1 hypothetical protein LAG90_15795 [Marinilongibacter aquaticus]